MAASTVHVIHGVVTPSAFYSQLENGRVATETDVLQALPSGHYQPMFTTVRSQRPVIEFTTHQIATLLGEATIGGVDLSGGNVDLYEKRVYNLGNRFAANSTVHNRYRCGAAMMYVASISAPHQGMATAQARVIPVYDGVNEPIVPVGSVALSGTPSASEYFGAGPVEIGGVVLPGVQQIDIDFAVRMIQAGGETEVWDSFCAIAEIVPRIRIRTITTTAFATYGLDGSALAGAGVEVWLRRKQADGTNVANGTATHVKFTIANGIIVPEETAGSGNDPNTTTLAVYARASSATGHSMTVDTASTIA